MADPGQRNQPIDTLVDLIENQRAVMRDDEFLALYEWLRVAAARVSAAPAASSGDSLREGGRRWCCVANPSRARVCGLFMLLVMAFLIALPFVAREI